MDFWGSLTAQMPRGLDYETLCKRFYFEDYRVPEENTLGKRGCGFMETSAVTRYWRQVKINEIDEGTSETNREIIARSLLAESPEEEEKEEKIIVQ